MAFSYPTQRSLAEKYVQASLADISADSEAYAPIPCQGQVVDVMVTLSAAITVADAVVTVSVIKTEGTFTLGTITAAYDGSAAGSTFFMVFTGNEKARSVARGDRFKFDSNGGSTTTSIANFLAVIRET